MNRKNIVILGSTGSIGKQALRVVSWFPDRFRVVGLSTNHNIELLEEQVVKFNVTHAAVSDSAAARIFEQRCREKGINCLRGPDGLLELVRLPEPEMILVAVSGTAGLLPTLEAIRRHKTIALANKETLVAGGSLVMSEARARGIQVIPVDSEHSAIHQCLNKKAEVDRLIITGSGGPFRGMTGKQLQDVTPEMALRHPTWQMGAKITIDSATLMNKGLEIIEAGWLFDMDYHSIEVLIHPQSIIHGIVVYQDGVVLAQLGWPDMHVPIQYALCYPEHVSNTLMPLDLSRVSKLTFEKPDLETFKCLKLAVEAGAAGGTMPAVLNAANEVAVAAFMQGRTSFLSIADIIERVMSRHDNKSSPDINEILAADGWARRVAEQILT